MQILYREREREIERKKERQSYILDAHTLVEHIDVTLAKLLLLHVFSDQSSDVHVGAIAIVLIIPFSMA